jgi:hypothetical protein
MVGGTDDAYIAVPDNLSRNPKATIN